jgi:hypothetical protein
MSLVNILDVKDIIGPAVAVAAVAVGIWQYRRTSQSEFTKPLREVQLKLYQEASLAASQIATLQRGSSEWAKAKQNFLSLYYGPLAIIENFDGAAGPNDEKLSVELAMIIFKSGMDDEQLCEELDSNLEDLSLALAHSCRESLGRTWGYALEQLEGKYQIDALEYWNKLQAKKRSSKE